MNRTAGACSFAPSIVTVTLNDDDLTFHVDNLIPIRNATGVPTPAWGPKGILTAEDTPQVPLSRRSRIAHKQQPFAMELASKLMWRGVWRRR